MPLVPTTLSRMIAATVPGPSTDDRVLEVLERPLALLGLVDGVERGAVEVRAPEVHDARHARLAGPPARVPGHRDRAAGAAVVAAVGREDLVPLGVHPRHPDRVLGGFRTAVGEEDHVEVAGRETGEPAGQLAPLVVGVAGGDRAEHLGLGLDRGDDLRVLVADVDVDHLRREVEERPPVVGPEAAALGAGDHERIERLLRRPRVEHVGAVVLVGLAALGRLVVGHAVPRFSVIAWP